MLIKVFGTWLNPRNITYLYVGKNSTDTDVHFGEFNGGYHEIRYKDKTDDEVAAEINKQLQEVYNEKFNKSLPRD